MLLFPVNGVVGQPYSFKPTHYDSRNIGLSHNTVLNMVTDSRGFVWVSTMDGLNRFDGKSVKVYRHDPSDSTTLSDSFIHGVYEHKNGSLLIGTRDGGLNILDPVTDKIQRVYYSEKNPTIPDAPVNVIFEDSKEDLWVGFFTNRIGYFDVQEKVYYPANLVEKGTNKGVYSVNSVLEFNDGAFLMSSLNGLYYLSAEEVSKFRSDPTSGQEIITTRILFSPENPAPNTSEIVLDSDNNLWVLLVGEALEKLLPQRIPPEVKKSIASGEAKSSIKNIYPERGEVFFKGGHEGHLIVVEKDSGEEISIKIVEGDGAVGASTVYEDHFGNLWFYTWGGGFYRLIEKKGISLYTNTEDASNLPSEFILGFEDGEDRTWIATNEGLAYLKDGIVTSAPGEFNERVRSIWALEDDELGLWLATRTQGLFLISKDELDKNRFSAQQFVPENSLVSQKDVHQVLRDQRGWLWIGYQGSGVQVIKNPEAWIQGEPANIQNLSLEDAEIRLNSNSIRRIYQDNDGNIWIATTDHGFNYVTISEGSISGIQYFDLDTNSGISIPHKDGRSVFQQNDSTFWFASYGGGIYRWIKGSENLTLLRTSEGLPNNSTYGILGDTNPDFIWVSTNSGLGRLNTKTLEFSTFTDSDGLQNNEFNTGAYQQGKNGTLYFGGVNGFNVIDTDLLKINEHPPQLFLTKINLFNEPLEGSYTPEFIDQVQLNHNQNFLSFEFSALDFEDPLANEYAYKMEGVDQDWVYSGNRNFADYPNLAPGDYTLLVNASNKYGVWNEEGINLSISILPPWWQTWWFRIIAGGMLLGGLVGLVRYYAQKKLKEELRQLEIKHKLRNERERISRDLHDHVGAQLANIMSGLSLIDKYNQSEQKEKSGELLHSLKGDADVTIKQLRDTIWALNQSDLNIEAFASHVEAYFRSQSALTELLKLTIELEGDASAVLSATQALNLFRIIQEASQNTMKYANAKSLSINFKRTNGSLEVSIKDDGTFKSDLQSFNGGYGMKNMQKRAKEINGKVEVNVENGTEIKVFVNL